MTQSADQQLPAKSVIRVGTRGSLLATTQTNWVVEQIRRANPTLSVEVEIIHTTGDLKRDIPFGAVGTKGMFVKEIEQALLDGSIDVGVHSLKDMPSELPNGLELACVPIRENPYDALVLSSAGDLASLKYGAIVGTSSVRRQAQIRRFRPDLDVRELRGNLDTRLRKLDEGQYDAIVLACAGLFRLGMGDRITQVLPLEISVPAAGQGALALETRQADTQTLAHLMPLHDAPTADAIAAERAFLAALGGGCSVPAGAHALIDGDSVRMYAMLGAPDGSQTLVVTQEGRRADAAQIGRELALRLLSDGGHDLLQR